MLGFKKPLGKMMLGYKKPLGKMRLASKMPLMDRPVAKMVEEALQRKVSGGLERRK